MSNFPDFAHRFHLFAFFDKNGTLFRLNRAATHYQREYYLRSDWIDVGKSFVAQFLTVADRDKNFEYIQKLFAEQRLPPHNPLGKVYPISLAPALHDFCNRLVWEGKALREPLISFAPVDISERDALLTAEVAHGKAAERAEQEEAA